jgi:hypothetical protein
MKINKFRIVFFILFLFCSDQLLGFILMNLYNKSNYQEFAKIRYTIDNTYQDILIFGSSRAQHHYVPDTIKKYTGLSAYNCGVGGQGLAFSYIQIHETLKRYKPKLIILDLSPNIIFDSLSEQKLKVLLPYYTRDTTIENILTDGSSLEKLKLISRTYPYNGTIINLLRSLFKYKPDTSDGYIALSGVIDSRKKFPPQSNADKKSNLPEKQNQFLEKIISECNTYKIRLVFAISPIYEINENERQVILKLHEFSQFNSVLFINCSSLKEFKDKKEYFRDSHHLNARGSSYFSKLFSRLL